MSDVLKIAKGEKGTGETAGGVSKYGRWLDQQAGTHLYYNLDWCGAFQMWAIAQGGPEWSAAAGGIQRGFAEVQVWFNWMQANGRISKTPKARRLVWYDWYGTPDGANHIGMVDHFTASTLWVWEGNYRNRVDLVERRRDSQIMGYGEWWDYIEQPSAALADSCWMG